MGERRHKPMPVLIDKQNSTIVTRRQIVAAAKELQPTAWPTSVYPGDEESTRNFQAITIEKVAKMFMAAGFEVHLD